MFFLNLANSQRLIALINKDMYIPVEIFTQLSTIVNLVYPKLNFVFFFLDFVIGENCCFFFFAIYPLVWSPA